jgi:hypothetical protein
MSKRPPIDLSALTSLTTDEAISMPEAAQRSASFDISEKKASAKKDQVRSIPVDYSDSLNFKVPPAFKERYRMCAAKARLKLNELLFEALDAWEAKQK